MPRRRKRRDADEHDDSGTPHVTREHNVAARRDAITKACEELYQLDVLIARATETHVKLHREAKTDIKSRLKEDYNITANVLAARYAPYKLERMAQDGSDDKTLDVIRELFDALPIGGMLDLVNLAQAAD